KLFALKAGLEAQPALLPQCDYILLTDADILHPPENARRLVAQAESTQSALVSLMALLDCRGFWGRLLIPPFVFFFQKLYPFRWVNDPEEAHAGAAGGCVLVRRNVLRSIGDMEGIRDALIDDCALAAAVKGNPPKRRIWLGLSQDVKSLRDNRAFGSIWTMVARTAFTQLRHSTGMLFLSIVGMILTYLAGPVVFVAGLSAGSVALIAIGITAWSLSALAYLPTLRLFGQNPLWAFTLPLAALLYSAMTVGSAVNHWRGHGGAWKGRSYSDLTKPSDASAPPKPS
ncbi:MAG: glycosyltransferase, partial [Pseudomonadota bacterium]